MADEATSQRESWWVLQAQSGNREALNELFKSEPAAFRAWAYQIASREAFRHLNRERRWSDQVRDETILKALPSDDHESEFAKELIDR